MKNVLKKSLFVSFFVLLFGLGSCVDEHYHVTESEPPFVKEYEVGTLQHVWRKIDTGLYYCDITINELTFDMYDNGILLAYFVHRVPDGIVDSPLPFDDFFIDDTGYQWTYQYTCEFSPGRVTFTFKDSSFFEQDPPTCTFVVKMMR